jgi:hypothetical protein
LGSSHDAEKILMCGPIIDPLAERQKKYGLSWWARWKRGFSPIWVPFVSVDETGEKIGPKNSWSPN